MLNLGHIIYSNCFPPHAGIITGKVAFPFRITRGIPAELNRLLSQGSIDVSPSSSIEYARNADRYLLLPGLSITSRNKVKSIILQSRFPIEELHQKSVALTTASATSVVLLKILLQVRYKIIPVYSTFNQGNDPFGAVDAMLFIGDHALRREPRQDYPYLYDLGALWFEFTGLPFVFALWQVNYKKNLDADLALLYDVLKESKTYGLAHLDELAGAHADSFDLPAELLLDYWSSFSYDLTGYEESGLLAYFEYAAGIGVIDPVKELHFWRRT